MLGVHLVGLQGLLVAELHDARDVVTGIDDWPSGGNRPASGDADDAGDFLELVRPVDERLPGGFVAGCFEPAKDDVGDGGFRGTTDDAEEQRRDEDSDHAAMLPERLQIALDGSALMLEKWRQRELLSE